MSAREWRPRASRATLEQRAALLARTRAFFAQRGVLEVETPAVVNAAVSDVHLDAALVQLACEPGQGKPTPRFLHTSPEYCMKRLLAAGYGDIVQICHVVRGAERSRLHNPEFTLIEWYRIGFALEALMDEVASLVGALLGRNASAPEKLTYREAFLRELALDPLSASLEELTQAARALGYDPNRARSPAGAGRDELLELLMGARVGPRLGRGTLTFVHGYPASQAALAELDPRDPRTALRFELYCEGIELANGFQELRGAREQRTRFEHDLSERQRRGLPTSALDERLLAALAAGLPACAGVALGFDRVVMLAAGVEHIDEVLAFPIEIA
jgi:lysyl-tRNA synthetase class 2